MYYFGKDFLKETDIPNLLNDFLKQKELKNNNQQCNTIQNKQKIEII
ncbi:hypothetical protein AAK894_06905 [Lachnospiraceae bacterium 46-61]